MNEGGKVSVIVPCYNQGKYLADALQSIYGQTWQNWEAIVINDGSTDNTEVVALEWANKDSRFKYFYKANGGLSSARNMGLVEARGAYIQFLDADDELDANKLKDSLEEGGDADVIISDFAMFNSEGIVHRPSTLLNKSLFNFEFILTSWDEKFFIPIHCALFKAAVFEEIRFNETLKAREDWLMWLQVYLKPVKTAYIDKPFALYRSVAGSMSQDRRLMNKNLVVAYGIIYKLLPDEYREMFFQKVVSSLGSIIAETEELLLRTRQSKSYRMGNFFVRRLK